MSPNREHRATGRGDEEIGAYYEQPGRAEGLARLYDAATPLGAFYRDRLERIAGLLDGLDGAVLDAGCGTGQMIRFLHATRPDRFVLTGLDRSASMIEVARQLVDDTADARLVVGRVEEMPFADAIFDVVLAMGSLEYVADLDQALAEIARVLRSGGRAVVTMGNPWSPYRLWDSIVWSRVRRRRGLPESPVVRRLGERELRLALRRAGLTPASAIHYGFNLFLSPLDSRFPGPALRHQRLLEKFARGHLRHLATDYAVVAHRLGQVAAPPASGPRQR